MEQFFASAIVPFLKGYPWFGSVVVTLGTLRLIVPPLQKVIMTIVSATPTDVDEKLARKAFGSQAWQGFLSFLDWASSIDSEKIRASRRKDIND